MGRGGGRTEGDVADLAAFGGADAGDALELERGIVAEEDLGGVLDGAAAGVDELLDEDLAEDAVGLFAEYGAEYDGDAVVARLDVDGLLVAVVDGHDLATLAHALGRLLGRVLGRGLLQAVVFLVGVLEGGGHGVALEQGDFADELIAVLCEFWRIDRSCQPAFPPYYLRRVTGSFFVFHCTFLRG